MQIHTNTLAGSKPKMWSQLCCWFGFRTTATGMLLLFSSLKFVLGPIDVLAAVQHITESDKLMFSIAISAVNYASDFDLGESCWVLWVIYK